MPKLWSETIEEHRSAVLDSILDATGRLVHREGITGLTMTALAEASGVGRATLYKYVPDVAAAVAGWQEREIGRHLQQLRSIAHDSPAESRLSEALQAYARLRRHQHGDDGVLHLPERISPAELELTDMVRELIDEDARAGRARTDIPADDLAAFAVHAMGAAATASDHSAVDRLTAVVVGAIQGPFSQPPARSCLPIVGPR